jgi:hypothetical protein
MAEIWGAAIMVVGAVASSQAAKKKAAAERKANKEDSSAMTLEESQYAAQRSGYDAALEDYYKTKDRYEQQRGLDQFRQFSTMGKFAPGMDDQGGRVVMPESPNYNDYEVKDPEADELGELAKPGKKKKKLTGLLAHDLGLF